MPTDTIQVNWSSSSGTQSVSGTVSDFGNTETNNAPGQSFSANTNAGNFALVFNAATIQMIYMISTANCTITTNNSVSPTNTLALVAGIPYYWERSSGYWPNAFNANTNAGFCTCNASTILNVRVLSA